MTLGIDASNLRAGGGLTHLVELLREADPPAYGFSRVIVWSSSATLARLGDRPWLVKQPDVWLERGWLHAAAWLYFRLPRLLRAQRCDVLFVPGGSHVGSFRPSVTMCRNMLPFEWRELRRFGISAATLRYLVLRWTQTRAFRRADGVIYLTEYARRTVSAVSGACGRSVTIPHGITREFFAPPRLGRADVGRPIHALYVSIVKEYKHQWHVAEAFSRLRAEGLPVMLSLVGPSDPRALARLNATLDRVDPARAFITYKGPVAHRDLPQHYAAADLCVFASTCENMPNILLEGMASGLPIVCSNRGPMVEVVGDGAEYFDPEDPESIATAIRSVVGSPGLRDSLSRRSYERARAYSWSRCADETFSFLAQVRSEAGSEVV